ncbi:hypothetical protein JW906_12550 [bacterium]|nr:hypothetical protein [bacterium]
MVKLHFDFRDLFRSGRLAFSFQRLWIQFIGFGAGYIGFVFFAYLALLLAPGGNLADLWSKYGLIPAVGSTYLPWTSWILFGIGIGILLYAWLISGLGVARATYMHLKGNHFYTWKEALRFALRKKGGSIAFTPVAIACIAFFTGLGGVFVALLGDIPYVGEIGLSLFTVIWFAASLFLVFVLLALAVSLVQTPAVLATTDDDAFEGVFQSFSTLSAQPWRLVIYEAIVVALSVIGAGVLFFFAKQAYALMTTLFLWGMGADYADLSYKASGLLQQWLFPVAAWSSDKLGSYNSLFLFSRFFEPKDLSFTMTLAAYIQALFMLLIGAFIFCYPLAVFNAGNTLLFLILKKKKDDENLLERKDKEEEVEEEEDAEKPAEDSSKSEKPARRTVRPAARKPAAKKKASRRSARSKR